MATEERGERAVLFSEAALRQDPEAAVEELESADVGVVIVGGATVVVESRELARTLEEHEPADLMEALEALHDRQPMGFGFQVDLLGGRLVETTSGRALRLVMSGIQLPSPDPTSPRRMRYRCTNPPERHVVHQVPGSVGAPCPKQLSTGGPCPGILEAY